MAWGGAELLFVGTGEGGVVGEAAELGCFQNWNTFGNLGAGKEKPLAGNIVMNGVSGFLLEFSHHVVFAEIIFPGQSFN